MELGQDYAIRQIAPSDKVKSFKTGSPQAQPLGKFLVDDAVDLHQQSISKTYVAVCLSEKDGVLVENMDATVLGYITVTCSEIDIRNGHALADAPAAMRYNSLPALKIARLCVDHRRRGEKIGEELLNLALAIATDQIAPTAGCRFLVTDSKQDAIRFYLKNGFTLLDTPENRQKDTPIMFLDILPHIREAEEAARTEGD
jgi:GNAT superfamily N-acetyltransferase